MKAESTKGDRNDGGSDEQGVRSDGVLLLWRQSRQDVGVRGEMRRLARLPRSWPGQHGKAGVDLGAVGLGERRG